MLTSLKHMYFSANERGVVRRSINDLKLPRGKEQSREVLIDVPDTLCECIEQLAFARYFSEEFQLSAATYIPGFTKKRRLINRLIGSAANAILSRGYRLALSLGMRRGLDAGIVNSQVLDTAHHDAMQFLSVAGSKEKVLDYELLGVKIGVAIYDSYLRETMKPTVHLDSPRFHAIVTDAFVILRATEMYFKSHDVAMVVLGHCVYNNWKILSDYAQARGAQVFVTYNSRVMPLHDVNASRGLQTTDHSTYKADFQRLPREKQELGRIAGAAVLARRLSGEVDPGISYMAASPYSGDKKLTGLKIDDNKKVLVMMLHSFFDSPHIYKSMIFPDFLAWVRETLAFLGSPELRSRYEIAIKPHPNRFPEEDQIVESILTEFKFVKFIDPYTSNAAIAGSRPACILTVYGSVAAEFAFQRVPVITCGDNPASSFCFTFEARDKIEYFSLLRMADELVVTEDQCRQIGEYMYMHYLIGNSESQTSYPFERYSRGALKKNHERIRDFRYSDFKKIVQRKLETLGVLTEY